MAGVKKPHPSIFNHALILAETNIKQSIMIGDSIDADVQGALDFGMEAILFDPNNQFPLTGISRINQLIELKKIF